MNQGYGGMDNNQGPNSGGPGSMYNSMPGYGANNSNGVPAHITSDPPIQSTSLYNAVVNNNQDPLPQ